MDMNEIANLTDHAAQQSDRWLFIAALVVLILFSLVIWRWIVADRDKLGSRLTEITDRHITAVEKMTEVVTNNTLALNEVKGAMHACRYKGPGS